MTELNCENICISAMARADGYRSELSSEQIDLHLAGCADCRHELSQLRSLASLLDKQERRQLSADIWTRIEERLPRQMRAKRILPAWYPFLLLCLFLLGYKLFEMIPDRELGLLFKLVPISLIVAAFGYLKENPFKINSQLKLEEEEVTR
jgi:predicted anti-sigma-YlaC factor YlaD